MTGLAHVDRGEHLRVLVCGSRVWADPEPIAAALARHSTFRTTIVHGGAPGADRLAGAIATGMGFAVDEFPAEWRRYGKAAGKLRNRRMLDSGIDVVYAFPLPSSTGTWHMVQIARAAGVPVVVWDGDDAGE